MSDLLVSVFIAALVALLISVGLLVFSSHSACARRAEPATISGC